MKEKVIPTFEQLHEQAASLSTATEKQWKKNWQKINFTATFPRLSRWIVSDGKKLFTEEQRELLFNSSIKTFLELPWNPNKGALAVHGFSFTREGNFISSQATSIETNVTDGQRANFESPLRANLASILLLGLSLCDKHHVANVFFENCQAITPTKQKTLRDQLSQLVTINNISRGLIKKYRLDALNDFDWDTEILELMLNLPSIRIDPTRGSAKALPYEMEFLDLKTRFSPQVIIGLLGYATVYVQKLGVPKHQKISRQLALFINGVKDFLSDSKETPQNDHIAYQSIKDKLDQLTQLIYKN